MADVDAHYYAYLIRDLAVRGFVTSLAKGIRERSTAFDSETLRSLVVPFPPLRVQRAIADFLDRETARIDALIEAKAHLSELLSERRREYVSRAVTVGLGESVALRSTGDEFAPEIPNGWRLMRLRHVVEAIVDTAHKTAPASTW